MATTARVGSAETRGQEFHFGLSSSQHMYQELKYLGHYWLLSQTELP